MYVDVEQKDKIKNDLSIDDVNNVIFSLSGEYGKQYSSALICRTICHCGHSHKLYYYDNTKLFRCYTQCNDTFDIFELVQKVNGGELYDAVNYVINCLNIKIEMNKKKNGFLIQQEKENEWDVFNIISSNKSRHKLEVKEFDDAILSRLPFVPSLNWVKENISVDTQKRFGIRYNPSDQSMLIPHYSIDGKLIGIRERVLVEEDEPLGKYKPATINGIMYNHPLSNSLYGLYENKDNIKRMRKVIIAESEKSVMMMETLFGREANIMVATCGWNLHENQVNQLLELGIDEMIICYDKQFKEIGDDEFKALTNKLEMINEKYSPRVNVSFVFDKFGKLDYKNSPIDKDKDTFQFLINNRISL